MNTQTLASPDKANTDACPRNGQVGRKVSSFTLSSQVREDFLATLPQREGFRFCAAEDCPVVYYHGGDGTCITMDQVRFPVFQKSTDPQRPVCYCFSHSVAEITDQVRATGGSTVPAEIKEQCAKGLDACERNNPQGSCCLGNVQKVVKAAQSSAATLLAADDVIEAACDGCCAAAEVPQHGAALARSRVGWWGLGAMFSALLASACCWLPLTLLLFGASAAGVAGFFESYRPWFLGISAVLLAGGFYVAYFRRNECAPGSACAVPRPGLQRFNRTMLWIATAATLALAVFPIYARYFVPQSATTSSASINGTALDLNIQGMTCEACAAGLQESLRRVPGVLAAEVNYKDKSARLIVKPDESTSAKESALSTITAAGYQATASTSSP